MEKASKASITIKEFQDLFVWQEGHKLVLAIYAITNEFPKSETFGLANQLRRASVSITSCIAEGFSRGSFKDKYNFYRMAQGSLTEVQNQIIIAKDIDYIEPLKAREIYNQTILIHKLLTGLCKSTKSHYDNP
jgi:four helix bundle protein